MATYGNLMLVSLAMEGCCGSEHSCGTRTFSPGCDFFKSIVLELLSIKSIDPLMDLGLVWLPSNAFFILL